MLVVECRKQVVKTADDTCAPTPGYETNTLVTQKQNYSNYATPSLISFVSVCNMFTRFIDVTFSPVIPIGDGVVCLSVSSTSPSLEMRPSSSAAGRPSSGACTGRAPSSARAQRAATS